MMLLYTVPGCPAVRRVKQYLKEHEVSFEEKNLYCVLLDREETLKMLACFPQKLPAEQAAAYYAANPSALPKPIIVCDDQELCSHLEELSTRHCNADCTKWQICGQIGKGGCA